MKRKIVNVATFILAVIMSVFVFASCKLEGKVEQATVIQSTNSILVIRIDAIQGEPTLFDAMTMLKEKGEMQFVSENSDFGQSIININGVENASDWSWYWASYTTDEENGTFAFNRDNTDWYYAAAGISFLPVKEGEMYMFEYIEFVYNG